jgi:hypothetical protein
LEVWELRFGCPVEHQLNLLPQHVEGTPSVFEYHPFRHIDFKEQAYIRKQPSQKLAARMPARGYKFFMDFGFLRASTDNYKRPNKLLDRIVRSYDGYCAYLLIVDGASRCTWVFVTASKEPPLDILWVFMTKFGNANGVVRTNQGGELARCDEYQH